MASSSSAASHTPPSQVWSGRLAKPSSAVSIQTTINTRTAREKSAMCRAAFMTLSNRVTRCPYKHYDSLDVVVVRGLVVAARQLRENLQTILRISSGLAEIGDHHRIVD